MLDERLIHFLLHPLSETKFVQEELTLLPATMATIRHHCAGVEHARRDQAIREPVEQN